MQSQYSPRARFAASLARSYEDFLRLGTFAPDLRASESPIAIACLRLFTFLPERPDLSVPRLRSCIARRTFFCALLPYFLRPEVFLGGIDNLHWFSI